MRRSPAVAVVLIALAASACSSHKTATPVRVSASPTPSTQQSFPYEDAVLADGAVALWPLRDADGLRQKDQVADVVPDAEPAVVEGGAIRGTTSPSGARAALFQRDGRIVTDVDDGLTSSDAFSLEMTYRVDACTTAWGRLLGTSAFEPQGREGIDVLHYPSQFTQSACRVGVEFWHKGAYVTGCHPGGVPPKATWIHFVLTYSAHQVTCYQNGRRADSEPLARTAQFGQPGPFGIGGSGSGYQGPADGASLSEIAVYDKVLTPAQVLAHARLVAKPLATVTVTPTPTPSPSP